MSLFGGGLIPLKRAAGEDVHSPAVGEASSELILSFGVPLVDGFTEPARPFGGVFFDFRHSDEVEVRQLALRLGQPLFGGGAEPPGGLRGVGLDPLAGQIAPRQAALRLGEPLFGGFADPFDPFGLVLRDPEPVHVAVPERVFGLRVPLFGGLDIPLNRVGGDLFESPAAGETAAELILRLGVILRGGLSDPAGGEDRVFFEPVFAVEVAKPQLALRRRVPVFGGLDQPIDGDLFETLFGRSRKRSDKEKKEKRARRRAETLQIDGNFHRTTSFTGRRGGIPPSGASPLERRNI